MKLHIAQDSSVYGQHVPVLTFCGRVLKRAIGWGLWGFVGHNKKDRCKTCLNLYRTKKKSLKG